jgi:hypothetical protein
MHSVATDLRPDRCSLQRVARGHKRAAHPADVLSAFTEVAESGALGGKSYLLCRALTSALVGRCLEPNTMSFEELLVTYGAPAYADPSR